MSQHALTQPSSHLALGAESRSAASPIRLLCWLVAGAALMVAPSALWANQVYKACGKKWVRQVSKLDAEKRAWMMEGRNAQVTADLDGDGRPDSIVMTNTPSFRDCDVKRHWDRRETTVRIEYGNGKKQVFFWISGQLVEEMSLFRDNGRILMVGFDAQGQQHSRWVEYATQPRARTAVATAVLQPDEGVMSLAGLSPPR